MGLSSNVPLVLVLCCDNAHDQHKKYRRNIQTDHWDWRLGQPRHEFLDVSNPENLPERGPKGGVIPEVEVKAVQGAEQNEKKYARLWFLRIIKSFPLLNSEELAELGKPEGNSLEGLSIGEQVVNSRAIC